MIAVKRSVVRASRRMNKEGRIPRPVHLSEKSPRWYVPEIRDWMVAYCPDRDVWERRKAR